MNNTNEKTMSRDEILNLIKMLSMSQGIYCRLLNDIYEDDSILDSLEQQGFKDSVNFVIRYEEGLVNV